MAVVEGDLLVENGEGLGYLTYDHSGGALYGDVIVQEYSGMSAGEEWAPSSSTMGSSVSCRPR